MTSYTIFICSLFFVIFFSVIYSSHQVPLNDIEENVVEAQNDDVERGLIDGIVGSSSTTTAKPSGGLALPSAGGIGQQVANAGPMLILGGFQAIVTKFDPSMIGSLPGLPGSAGSIFSPSKATK
jgi:hypothetical protein